MDAYIYARFSTLEQSKGSSLSRQLDDCRSYCDRLGWHRSSDRELIDEGRSAFDGANRSQGSELANFERMALDGKLRPDTVLVVERLDRLSRQSAVDVFHLITLLTDAGVAVATVDGERVYRKGGFNFANLIELIVKAQVSHEESEKKSQRLSAAWARKRLRASAGDKTALTRRCPAWIAVDKETGQYVLVEDRAAIVRRIFDLTTRGFGKQLVARRLNEERVPVWGRGEKGWHPSYIQKIISSRAVIGELQPHRKVAGKRLREGEPLRGHYPAVIDQSTFSRAQAERAGRTSMRGRRGKRVSNLISGLAKCGECGAAMAFRNKGGREQYLVCDGASRGMGCTSKTHFNYLTLERTIIDQTLHLTLDDNFFPASGDVAELLSQQAKHENLLDEITGRQRRLVDLLSRIENAEVERQLQDLAIEAEEGQRELLKIEARLIKARGAVSPLENVARIRDVLSALHSEDESSAAIARATVQQALRSLILSVTCCPRDMCSYVQLQGISLAVGRDGRLLKGDGSSELGLSSLLELRARGWVLEKHRNHPALGKSSTKRSD